MFKVYLDGEYRSDLSSSLTVYDSTDWKTIILETDPANGLPIAHNIRWNTDSNEFIKEVRWDVAPDMRRREIIPAMGVPGRYHLTGFYVTYIGEGVLYLYADQVLILTQVLPEAETEIRKHYYLPAGTYANVVMYDYEEISKDSIFIFNVQWMGTLIHG